MTLRTGSLGWMTRVAEPRATLGSESVITCRMTSEWSLVVFFFDSLSTSTPSRFISRLLGGDSPVFLSACKNSTSVSSPTPASDACGQSYGVILDEALQMHLPCPERLALGCGRLL